MNLREQGFRFCISPDKTRGRWIHPIEYKVLYSDWSDHTDTPEKEFIEFLQSSIDTDAQQYHNTSTPTKQSKSHDHL